MEIIIYLLLLLGFLDLILISILFTKKTLVKIYSYLYNVHYKDTRIQITEFINGKNKLDFLRKNNILKKMIIVDLCNEYLKYVSGSNRRRVLIIVRSLKISNKHIRNLKKKSWLKKAIAAHYLGMYEHYEGLPMLIENLSHENPIVFYNCAKAIIQISGKKFLKEILDSNSTMNVDDDKLINLLSSTPQDIHNELFYLINTSNKRIKCISIQVLCIKKDARIIPFVKKLLENECNDIRHIGLKAVKLFGYYNDNDLFLLVDQCKTSSNPDTLELLANTIILFEADKIISTLEALYKSSHINVSVVAAQKLLKLGSKGSLVLAKGKFSNNDRQRNIAIHALEKNKVYLPVK